MSHPSEFDEDLFLASITSFVSNFQLIDNIGLNILVYWNRVPNRLIKKRAESERKLTTQSRC